MSVAASNLCEVVGCLDTAADAADARAALFVWTLLPRHGCRPIRFLGREMLRADNRGAARFGNHPYWADIQLYELYAGGFVAGVRHMRAGEDRAVWQDAWHSRDPAGITTTLRSHDIEAALPGGALWPDGEAPGPAWHALLDAVFGAAGRS
jgi:hypothetical protein